MRTESASARLPLARHALRWLLWGLTVLALLLAAGWVLLGTDWAHERLRRLVEERAAAALGREVSVGSVELDLLALAGAARSIVIGGPAGLSDPLASVDALSVQVGPGLLRSVSGGPLVLRQIVVSGPVIDLVFDEEGNSNLPDLGGDGKSDGAGAVQLETLHIDHGLLRLEELSTPLDLAAFDVRAALREAGSGAHRLEASSGRIRVELADLEPLAGALDLRATIADGGVTIDRARLEVPHLSAEAAGRIEAAAIELDLTTTVDTALLAELGWTDAVSGRLSGVLRLEKRTDMLRLRGDLSSPALGLGTVEVTEVRADLDVGSEGLELRLTHGLLAGGRIEADVAGALGGSETPLDVALRLDGVDSRGLLEALGRSPASGMGGLLSGDLDYRFTVGEPLGGSGSGRLTLAPLPERSQRRRATNEDWRLAGNAEVVYEAGRLTIDGTVDSVLGRETLVRAEADLPLDDHDAPIDTRLEVSGLDLPLLLAAVSDPPPLMGVEGLVSATASYRFAPDDPLAGSGRGRLRLTPPAGGTRRRDGPRALVLSGQTEVSMRSGVLSTSNASLSAPGQQIGLAARIDLTRSSGTVDLDVSTEDLSALLETVPALRATPGTESWEPSRGSGSATGTLAFEPGGFTADLDLDLEHLSLASRSIARGAGRLLIDSGGIQLMDLTLEDEGARLHVAGTVPFDEPASGYSVPELGIDLEVERWRLADAETWVPFELPLAGRATGTLRLSGSFEALSGRLDASIGEMELTGAELPGTVAGIVDFSPDSIGFGPVRYSSSAGVIDLAGTYDPEAGTVDLELDSSDLDLSAPLFRERVPGDLTGRVQARASLEGSLERPSLELELVGYELALAGTPLGDTASGEGGVSRLNVSAVDGVVSVAGSLLGLISLDGGGRWDQEGVDLEIGVESSSMAELAGLVIDSPPRLTGSLSGRGTFSNRGESVTAALVLDHFELGLLEGEGGDRRLRNVEPIRVDWTDDGLMLESLYLEQQGSDSELFVRGLIGSADSEMDLDVQSSIDAGWLTFMVSGVDVAGRFEVLASVKGSWSEPQVDGQARIVGGRVLVENFPHAVEGIEGLLFLYPDRIVIDSGEARFARGRVTADGTIVIAGEDLGSYEVRLRGADLDIRYPEEWRIRAGGQMTLSSSGEERLLSGVVEVDRATYARDFELGFASLMRAMFERRPDLVEETEEVLRQTRLNVAVRGEGALQIQTNIATLSGDLDFAVRGSLAQPVILGEVELDRGGTVELGGNEYTLERGGMTFSNPFRNEPSLDLVASTTVREFDVRLNVFGPVDALRTSFSSTPPLPSLDVVSLLTTRSSDTLGSVSGRTSLDQGGEATTAETFLASQAASLAGQRVGSLFGLDQVQITPLTGASSELSAARITVGKRVSRDLYITYSYDPSESGEEIVEVAWQMYPTIVLLLRATDQGSYTTDIRWTKSF